MIYQIALKALMETFAETVHDINFSTAVIIEAPDGHCSMHICEELDLQTLEKFKIEIEKVIAEKKSIIN